MVIEHLSKEFIFLKIIIFRTNKGSEKTSSERTNRNVHHSLQQYIVDLHASSLTHLCMVSVYCSMSLTLQQYIVDFHVSSLIDLCKVSKYPFLVTAEDRSLSSLQDNWQNVFATIALDISEKCITVQQKKKRDDVTKDVNSVTKDLDKAVKKTHVSLGGQTDVKKYLPKTSNRNVSI